MPLYYFRIRNGRHSGASDHGTELADRNAAWNELTSVCGDVVGGISRKLRENSDLSNPPGGGIAGLGPPERISQAG
jgi:hypothetical protein